jgi:putative DNA primase/helicase
VQPKDYDGAAARLDGQPPARLNGHHEPAPPELALRRASDIPMEPISWMWSGWLAAGKLHMLGGVPGTGKTTIALAIAATVSRGGHWPDGAPFKAPGNVILWSGEDDASDTLVPRLSAMNADLARVHIVSHLTDEDGRRPFDPAQDMPLLIAKAQEVGDVRLLIVDPVVTAIAGDSHKNAEVRRGLAPLVVFAESLRAAVIGITHFSKGTQGRDPLDRLTGSLAFGAAPRIVFAASKKIAEDGTEEGRVFVRVKSNIGPDGGAIGYLLAQVDLPQGIVTSRVSWGAAIEGTARDILADAEQLEDDASEVSALDEAKAFLQDALLAGPKPANQVFKEAREAGHSEITVKRAKQKLGVVSIKGGMSEKWCWALPTKEINPPEGSHHKSMIPFGQHDPLRGLHGPEGDQADRRGSQDQVRKDDLLRDDAETF